MMKNLILVMKLFLGGIQPFQPVLFLAICLVIERNILDLFVSTKLVR